MKKTLLSITLLLLLCLLLSPVCSAAEAEEGVTLSPANTVMGEWDSYILGDADMDGKITNADVLAIFRYLYDAEEYPLPILCNHTFGEWTVADKPTCQKEGLKTRSCSKCGGTEEEVLPIVDHNYLATVIAPTQTEQGYTKHTCDMCGDSYNDTFVAPTGKTEGLDYTVNADGTTCTVTGLGGCTDTVINIPSEIDGYTVTAIGDKAFAEKTALTAIYIPDTVKTIGTRAFYACSGLTEMTIPASVTSIGTQIFYKCDNLKTVYYNSTYSSSSNLFFSQSSVEKVVFGGKEVPDYICENSAKIKTVEIKDSVTSIGSEAFFGCTSLSSITIPDSVTSIDNAAFYGCKSLASITIPDSVTSIGYSAFYDCTSLASITIGNSVTSIGRNAFYGCTSLASITIPDSVTSIGESAFSGCTSLESIIIPDSVTSIGSSAFYNCTSLASITLPFVGGTKNGTWNTHFGYIFGASSYSNNSNYVPQSLKTVVITGGNIAHGSFSGCKSLANITIGNSVTSIGNFAFEGCTSLASITIGNSVASIGSYTFSGCKSLTGIYVDSSNTAYCSIDGNLYSKDQKTFIQYASGKTTTSFIIPDSVASIGDRAFSGCTSLSSITIPDSVANIGDYAFCYCTSLSSITIPDSVTSIGDWAFYDCTSLSSITIPDSVTSIGDSAFYNCTNLASITIPDSVTSIGNSAFSYCTSLTGIYVDSANTAYCSIDGNLYSKDQKTFIQYASGKTATSFTIPDSVTSIGSYAFEDCSSLTNVTIGNGVTSIGYKAFFYCTSLESITIPDSVTSIGDYTFYDCTSLKTVYYTGTPEKWGQISIGDLNSELTSAARYYYSEAAPTDTTYPYWHYVNGVPTKW